MVFTTFHFEHDLNLKKTWLRSVLFASRQSKRMNRFRSQISSSLFSTMSGKEVCDKCICKGCVCRKCNCKRKSGNSTEATRDTVCGDSKCNEDVGKLVVNRTHSDVLANRFVVVQLQACSLLGRLPSPADLENKKILRETKREISRLGFEKYFVVSLGFCCVNTI